MHVLACLLLGALAWAYGTSQGTERGWQLRKVYTPMVSVWSTVFGVINGRLETRHLLALGKSLNFSGLCPLIPKLGILTTSLLSSRGFPAVSI